MTSILLIISFLLHLILLVIIYQLYQQIQNLKSERSRDTEVLLSRFLDEIKQENRQLQQQLQQPSGNENQTAVAQETEKKQKQTTDFTKEVHETSAFPPIPKEMEDKVETSVESQVFQMNQKGIPVESIAKKLNLGKTEVELLIKLHHPQSK